MLGSLARSWKGAALAAALFVLAGVVVCLRCSSSRPRGPDQMLFVCLHDGTRFLAPAVGRSGGPPKCPKCGGTTIVARVFECSNGHLFVGYLERPPSPDTVKTDDDYARYSPLLLRPGIDEEWTPGSAGRIPLCPVCKGAMKRPIVDFAGIELEGIHMGKLPAPVEDSK